MDVFYTPKWDKSGTKRIIYPQLSNLTVNNQKERIWLKYI